MMESCNKEEAAVSGWTFVSRPWLLELLHELKKRKDFGSIKLRDDPAITAELTQSEGLRISLQDLKEAMWVLPPLVQERLDRLRAVTTNANVASSSVIGSGAFTELHVENSVRKLRYKMEGRGRDEDVVDEGAAGRMFLLAEFDRQHCAAIRIQAAFRGYKVRRRIKGTWAEESNEWLGFRSSARYMESIGHRRQPKHAPGTPTRKSEMPKKSSEDVALSLQLAEVMVARIEAAAEQRMAEGIMRVPAGGRSSRYLMNDPDYRRIVLGEDFVETPEEAEARKAREYEEWLTKKKMEEEARWRKLKAREDAIGDLVSALLEEAKLDSRMEAARARAAAEYSYIASSRSDSRPRRASSSAYSSLNNSRRTSLSGSESGSFLTQLDLAAEIERRNIIIRIDERLGYLDSVLDVSMDELQTLKGQIGGLEDGLSNDVKVKLTELLDVVEADVLEVNHQEKHIQSNDGVNDEAIVPAIPMKALKRLIDAGKGPVDPRPHPEPPKFQPPIFAKEAALLKSSVLPHVPVQLLTWGPSNASPMKPAADPPNRIFPSPSKPSPPPPPIIYAGSILRKKKEGGEQNGMPRRATFADPDETLPKEISRLSVRSDASQPNLEGETSGFVPVTQNVLHKILHELKKRGLRPPDRLQDPALRNLASGAWVLLDDVQEALKRLPNDVSKKLKKEALSAASETEEDILRKHVGTVFANTDGIIFSFDPSLSTNPTLSTGFDRRTREEVLLSRSWIKSLHERLVEYDIEPTARFSQVVTLMATDPSTSMFWVLWPDVISLMAKLPSEVAHQFIAEAESFMESISPEMVQEKSRKDKECLVSIEQEDFIDLLSELQDAGVARVPSSLFKDASARRKAVDLAEALPSGPIKSIIKAMPSWRGGSHPSTGASSSAQTGSHPTTGPSSSSQVLVPRATLLNILSESGPLNDNGSEETKARSKDLQARLKKAMSMPRRAAIEVAVDRKWLRFFLKEAETQGVDLTPSLVDSYRSSSMTRPMSSFPRVTDLDEEEEEDGVDSSLYDSRCWVMKDDIDSAVSQLPPQSIARLAVVTQRRTLINDMLNHSGLDKRIAAEVLVEAEWLRDLAFELKRATGLIPKTLAAPSRPQSGLPNSVRWVSVADVDNSLQQLPPERSEHLLTLAEEAMASSPALMIEASSAFVPVQKEDIVSLFTELQEQGVTALDEEIINERRFATRRHLFALVEDLPPGPLRQQLASERDRAAKIMERMDSFNGPVIAAPQGTIHLPRGPLSNLLQRVSFRVDEPTDASKESKWVQISNLKKAMSMPQRPAVQIAVDLRWLKELVRELKLANVRVSPSLLHEPSLVKMKKGKKDSSGNPNCWLMKDDVDDALFQLSPESITRLSLMMKYILLQGRAETPVGPIAAPQASVKASVNKTVKPAGPITAPKASVNLSVADIGDPGDPAIAQSLPILPSFPPQAVITDQGTSNASEPQKLAQVIEIPKPYQQNVVSEKTSDLLMRRFLAPGPQKPGQTKVSVIDVGGSGSSRASEPVPTLPNFPPHAPLPSSCPDPYPSSVAIISDSPDPQAVPQPAFPSMPAGPVFRSIPRSSVDGQVPTPFITSQPGRLDQAVAANRVSLSMDIWKRAQFDINQYRGEVGTLSPHLSYERLQSKPDDSQPSSLGMDSQQYAAGLEGVGLPVVVGVKAFDPPNEGLALLPVGRTSLAGGPSSPHGMNKTLNDTILTLRHLAAVSEGGLPPPLAASKSTGSISPSGRQARASISGAFPSTSPGNSILSPSSVLPSLASPLGRVARSSVAGSGGGLSPMRNRTSMTGGITSPQVSQSMDLGSPAKSPSFLPKLK